MHVTTESTRPATEIAEHAARQAPGARRASSWIPTPEAPTAPWWILGECTCPENCRIDHEHA